VISPTNECIGKTNRDEILDVVLYRRRGFLRDVSRREDHLVRVRRSLHCEDHGCRHSDLYCRRSVADRRCVDHDYCWGGVRESLGGIRPRVVDDLREVRGLRQSLRDRNALSACRGRSRGDGHQTIYEVKFHCASLRIRDEVDVRRELQSEVRARGNLHGLQGVMDVPCTVGARHVLLTDDSGDPRHYGIRVRRDDRRAE
jgi:hypothetical protein